MGVTEENLGTYSETSVISLSIPAQCVSIAEPSPSSKVHILSAGEMAGYSPSTTREDAVQKSLAPRNLNDRAKIWMSQDLKIFPNSEYVHAISPIALALFWGKGGREIPTSEPLSMILTILTHCLNTSDVSYYFARTQGRWFCLDAMLRGDAPLAPLGDFPGNPTGPSTV